MSASLTVPVSAGLAVGIGFILVFSLVPMIIPSKEPVMYLTTTNEGKSYRASTNQYCMGVCDFLAYSRVIPLGPTVHISKESDFVLRTNSFEQPKTIRFYIQDYGLGASSGFDPVKKENGAYQIPSSLDSGEYLIDVLAFWDNENRNSNTSIHRFKVIVN